MPIDRRRKMGRKQAAHGVEDISGGIELGSDLHPMGMDGPNRNKGIAQKEEGKEHKGCGLSCLTIYLPILCNRLFNKCESKL